MTPGAFDHSGWVTEREIFVLPFFVTLHWGMYKIIGYYPDTRKVDADEPLRKDFVVINPPLVIKLYPGMAVYIGQWSPRATEDAEKNSLTFTVEDRLIRDQNLIRAQLAKLSRSDLIENFVPRLINGGNSVIQRGMPQQ